MLRDSIVSKDTYVLLPIAESGLLRLDLLRESFSELLFLLLELGVILLLDFGLSEFARLHLLLTVVFVVRLLRCRDQVQHVGSDEEGTKLSEVTVVLVLDYERKALAESSIRKNGGSLPSATPHRYSRPLTVRPSAVFTSSVLPMMEKGIVLMRIRASSALCSSSASIGGW